MSRLQLTGRSYCPGGFANGVLWTSIVSFPPEASTTEATHAAMVLVMWCADGNQLAIRMVSARAETDARAAEATKAR